MRVFVDLGAFDGRSTRAYEREHKLSFAYLWEPNPLIAIKRPKVPHSVICAAAWVQDGRYPFFLSSANKRYGQGQGSTLLGEKTTGELDKNTPLQVATMDFGAWLTARRSRELVVKVNIEGAEYALLQHLAETHALDVPREWLISWHGEKVGRTEKDAAHLRWYLRYAGFQELAPEACLPETFERWAR